MGLSAVEKFLKSSKTRHSVNLCYQTITPDFWLARMQRLLSEKYINNDFEYNTTVHPCLINSRTFLVDVKGL